MTNKNLWFKACEEFHDEFYRLEHDDKRDIELYQLRRKNPCDRHGGYAWVGYCIWDGDEQTVVMDYVEAYGIYMKRKKDKLH